MIILSSETTPKANTGNPDFMIRQDCRFAAMDLNRNKPKTNGNVVSAAISRSGGSRRAVSMGDE